MNNNHWNSASVKQNIIDQSISITHGSFYSWEELKNVSTEMKQLMEEWKCAGYAGDQDKILWNNFRSVRDSYFQVRDDFIQDVHDARERCISYASGFSEMIATASCDFEYRDLTEQIRQLQEEWKCIQWIGRASWLKHDCKAMSIEFRIEVGVFYSRLREKKSGKSQGNSKNFSENKHQEQRKNRQKSAHSGANQSGRHDNFETILTLDAALRVFELKEPLTLTDIKFAYRRLIGIHHPDKGGSAGKAQQINSARAILVNHFRCY